MSPTTGTTLAPESKTKAKKSSKGCGCSSTTPQKIDPKIQERIEKHPCYSEEAHHQAY